MYSLNMNGAYADDTAIILDEPTWGTVHEALERELRTLEVAYWLSTNLLTFNTEKTNYICFSK